MSYPAQYRYTSDHEWIHVEGGIGTVGITRHAQDQLGDIVHVELPSLGKVLKKGASAAEVESVKAVSDIYAPVSGEVIEVNSALDGNEGVINKDPHGEGWLFRLRLTAPAEVDGLMDAGAYFAHAGD